MFTRARVLIAVGVIVVLGAGTMLLRGDEDTWVCDDGVWVAHGSPSAQKPPDPCGPVPPRISASSETPAAGVCAEPPSTPRVVLSIRSDVPSPRCQQLEGDEMIIVRNETDREVRLSFDGKLPIGVDAAVVEPGELFLFPQPAGTFLAPGVHRLGASPFSGPEVWVMSQVP